MKTIVDYIWEKHLEEQDRILLEWVALMSGVATAILMAVVMVCLWQGEASASEITDSQAVHCILGEAQGEYRTHGRKAFLAVAEGIRNRGHIRGVYGCKADMSKDMPYLKAKGLDDAALYAWWESERTNIVNGADHWESIDFSEPWWAKDMIVTAKVGKHVFYK